MSLDLSNKSAFVMPDPEQLVALVGAGVEIFANLVDFSYEGDAPEKCVDDVVIVGKLLIPENDNKVVWINGTAYGINPEGGFYVEMNEVTQPLTFSGTEDEWFILSRPGCYID